MAMGGLKGSGECFQIVSSSVLLRKIYGDVDGGRGTMFRDGYCGVNRESMVPVLAGGAPILSRSLSLKPVLALDSLHRKHHHIRSQPTQALTLNVFIIQRQWHYLVSALANKTLLAVLTFDRSETRNSGLSQNCLI
ncbi:hypothetical protein CBL_05644 [Carabus blaptoides fortunei]